MVLKKFSICLTPNQKTQPLAGFLIFYQDEIDLHGNPARILSSGSAQVAETVDCQSFHHAVEFT
jgi:hypothetical protein